MMHVAEAAGRLVRDTKGRRIAEKGADVDELDPFWSRLLRDGDVVEADADGKPLTKATAAPAATAPTPSSKATSA